MSVFDVVVNTDDLVVLGPPDVIDLAISVGRQGNRGSTFYAGAGDPNSLTVSENIFAQNIVPVAGDVFINAAVGPEYGWLYIYNPKIVGNQWDQILRLQSPFFASSYQRVFSSGETTVSVPLTSILPPNVFQNNPDNYIVLISPISETPTVLTIKSKIIASGNLQILISGIEFDGTDWSEIDGTISFSINISVV
jgi:hypothetical protein